MQNNYYLGIDVSKGYADFVFLNTEKKPIVENFQLDDTFEGHCFLYNKLFEFVGNHPKSKVFAAVESTGGYENNWFHSLVSFQSTLNLKTARLNPCGVNANSKASMNRNTTDKISAQNVAEYLISHPENVSYQNQDQLVSLRKQWSFVKMLTKQNTQLLNQLESLLYSANPEILVFCKGGVSQWILKLLLHYPTSACLSKARSASVARIPYISANRAQTLIANAKKSVASAVDNVTENLIVATVQQILHLKKTITDQTKIMADQCSVSEIELLKSFTGISDYSAIGLMLEIQTVKRFSNTKKLASFFGLHPVFKVSGDGKSGIHMSKKGRKEPRRILFMVALTAIRTNPLIRDIYQKHVQKGMAKMAAIGLCMHKILRVIYGMLKNNRPFDPEVDRKNREKSEPITEKTKPDKNRRYQEFDSMAPVSRRQNLNRKEREQSQSDNIAENGIIAPAQVSG
jgi:transposase